MSDNMHDVRGWKLVPCAESDEIRQGARPRSSLTDLEGTYGTAVVYTEWSSPTEDHPILRDYRWPQSDRECEHYVPEASA
jgi:hypothetical protein